MTELREYPDGVFCWVDLNAHDLEAAKRWYCELFGWTVENVDTQGGPPYAMFHKHGKLVAGAGQMSEEMRRAGVPPLWNNYVKVSDCAAIEAKAAELGGKVAVPTMQVMDAGRLCFLQDPSGASFALWEPITHHGARLVNAPGAFCWNELATRDVDGAKRFYATLLGWEYGSDASEGFVYTTIKAGGRENGGMIPQHGPTWEGIPSYWNTFFAVDDADAALAKITATGGKLLFGPRDIPGVGRFAVVNDPQGAMFTVIHLTHPPE
jgi:predicted enzyme related to lactoylglutathione lyase